MYRREHGRDMTAGRGDSDRTRRLLKIFLILVVLLIGPILCLIWYSTYA